MINLQSNYGRVVIELQLIYDQTTVKLQIALLDNYLTLRRTYDYVTLCYIMLRKLFIDAYGCQERIGATISGFAYTHYMHCKEKV